MKRNYLIICIVLCLLSLGACKRSECRSCLEKKYSQQSRALLFYLAGDNNLAFDADNNRQALLEAWTPKQGPLLVFSETDKKSASLEIIILKDGKKVWQVVKTYQEENSASPELLKQVIQDTKEAAPLRSYGLVLFSHATGWLPQKAFSKPNDFRSIMMDKDQEMSFNEFCNALPDSSFDFIAFNMCFMSGIETSYALRKKTPLIIASTTEILSPGFIPVYKSNLEKLYRKEPDAVGFAKAFYKHFEQLEGQYRSATISVIKTEKLDALAEFVKAHKPKQLSNEAIASIQHFDRKNTHLFFDLRSYLLKANEQIKASELNKYLDDVLLYKGNTGKIVKLNIKEHSGFNTYIPQDGLPKLNEAYQETAWAKFLKD